MGNTFIARKKSKNHEVHLKRKRSSLSIWVTLGPSRPDPAPESPRIALLEHPGLTPRAPWAHFWSSRADFWSSWAHFRSSWAYFWSSWAHFWSSGRPKWSSIDSESQRTHKISGTLTQTRKHWKTLSERKMSSPGISKHPLELGKIRKRVHFEFT